MAEDRGYRAFWWVVYGVSLAGWAYLAWRGWDFYTSPLIERPRHEDYWELKPGGSQGILLGIVGSGLMVVMLTYSLRKRVGWLRKLGPLSRWLDFHIYCGVMGPLLILLHSSFKVTGLVALSFWSMVVVAASGVAGRYLYLQIPRRRSGDELTLGEVTQMEADFSKQLREKFGLQQNRIERLDSLAALKLERDGNLLGLLVRLPFEGARLKRRLATTLHAFSDVPRNAAEELASIVQKRAELQRRLHLWNRLQTAFHYWHVLHKPFAVIMYLFMIIHIAVALSTGYGWRAD